jgi:abelson tyrosine-protein kinase 1
MRPSLPSTQLINGPLMNVIRASWDQLPVNRPSFEQIARDIKKLRTERSAQSLCTPPSDSPRPSTIMAQWGAQSPYRVHHSPDILPLPLPDGVSQPNFQDSIFPVNTSNDVGHPGSALGLDLGSDEVRSVSIVHGEEGRAEFPGTGNTRSSSISSDTISSSPSILFPDQSVLASGYLSPLHHGSLAATCQDERRYRMLLQHDFYPIRRFFIISVATLSDHLLL